MIRLILRLGTSRLWYSNMNGRSGSRKSSLTLENKVSREGRGEKLGESVCARVSKRFIWEGDGRVAGSRHLFSA